MKTALKLSSLYLFIFLLTSFPLSHLDAQANQEHSQIQKDNSGFYWGIYLLRSIHLETALENNSRWSGFGLGIDIGHQFRSGLGLGARLNYRNWDNFDKTLIPLSFGPTYRFPSNSKMTFFLFGGIGPAAVIGNDYASVFASLDLGMRLEWDIGNHKKFFIGSDFGQGMSFHPDHFEYVDLSIGMQF